MGQYVTDPSAPTASEKFLCGSGAGAAASVVAQPMNTVGARLAVAKTGMYSSIPDCLRKTFQVRTQPYSELICWSV